MFVFLILGLFALFSCSTPSGASSEDRPVPSTGSHTVLVVPNPLSLADILLQVPGVQVRRNLDQVFVTIRGGVPLYFIDGMRIGNDYNKVVELVNIFDIKSVEVIRGPAETAIYGPGSGHGVVLINTIEPLEEEME